VVVWRGGDGRRGEERREERGEVLKY